MTTWTFSVRARAVAGPLFAWAAAACAASPDAATAESESVATADDASSLAGRFTYFVVRPDTRRCTFPSCGGYFVARANQATTRCGDGADRAECYVVELDLEGAGVSVDDAAAAREDAARVLVRGSVKARSYGTDVLDVFDATEVWRSSLGPAAPADGAAPPAFFRLAYAGACGEGCPSLAAAPLNASLASVPVSWIALDRALVASERGSAIDAAFRSRLLSEGALVAPTGDRRGSTFVATRTFLRVESGARLDEACTDTGTCREGFACCAGRCAAACR